MSAMFSTRQIVRRSEGVLSLTQVRWASSTESKPLIIDKNISYRPAVGNLRNGNRPLVIVYGWLVAKAKHIYKYGDFYLGKGFDVMHVKVKPGQLLRPPVAQSLVTKVLDCLSEEQHRNKPLLIHAFSIGGYLCGETLVKIHNQADDYGHVGQRIKGQILDSPADFETIPFGFSRAVTPVPAVQVLMQKSLETYLGAFPNSVTRHYQKSSEAMHDNKLKTPTLFLYSDADPVGAAGPIEKVMEAYKENGIATFGQRFVGSPHVSHFHQYPVEYIGQLNRFLEMINLTETQANLQQAEARP